MVKNSERYVPKFHAELNIESVLIAPLVAASKANVMMLSGQARFLLDYCFSLENGIYKPVMIPMTITKEFSADGIGISSTTTLFITHELSRRQ